MQTVSRLSLQEHAGLDCGRLEEILIAHGERGAERILSRTLEDVAVRLNRIDRSWQRGETTALCRSALALSDVAADIGLTTLSRVARDVSEVAGRSDPAALSATVSRMVRVGEATLMRIWDIRDESI